MAAALGSDCRRGIDTGYRPVGVVSPDGVPPTVEALLSDVAPWPELDIYAKEDAPPRLAEGTYTARVARVQVYDKFFKVARSTQTIDRLILTFRIVDGPNAGTELPFYAPLPKAGGRKGRLIPAKSKFWRAWTIANGAAPRRADRMSLNVFKNRLFTILVRDVDKDRRQNNLGDAAKHSVVDCIVDRQA